VLVADAESVSVAVPVAESVSDAEPESVRDTSWPVRESVTLALGDLDTDDEAERVAEPRGERESDGDVVSVRLARADALVVGELLGTATEPLGERDVDGEPVGERLPPGERLALGVTLSE